MEYVLHCLEQTASRIGNIKAYILTSLFNATATNGYILYDGGAARYGYGGVASGHGVPKWKREGLQDTVSQSEKQKQNTVCETKSRYFICSFFVSGGIK